MLRPPSAPRRPSVRNIHGVTTTDDYAWMRQREDPRVLAYLKLENEYTEALTAHLAGLRDQIFLEIKAKVAETDLSAPARRGDWWYGRRTEAGRQYPLFVRWRGSPEGEEEVLIDQNELAAGHDFCNLGLLMVNHDQTLLAYSVDLAGDEVFTLRFRHLAGASDPLESLTGTYYGGAWSADGQHFFYVTIDHAHRPYRLWRHRLATEQADDVLVYEEPDERFYLTAEISRDHSYILVQVISSTTSEVSVIPADQPELDPVPLLARTPGVRYQAEHRAGRWLIVTDEDAPQGQLVSYPAGELVPAARQILIPHDPLVKVARVLPFSRHLVVTGRREGLPSVTAIPDEAEPFDLTFPQPSYSVALGDNFEFDTSLVRVEFESFLTSPRILDVDLDTGAVTVVKETPVPGDYQPDRYAQERIWATGGDGVVIPVSLVYRRGLEFPAPTMIYGYGAYESVVDPWFAPGRFSLLDRGVVYAIAHVRGGGEMGRLWHEGGRMARKRNTCDDFIAVAEHLVAVGVAEPGRLAARGASAGGLLMGAITTMRPDLWAVVVAEVPFVDVVNTMLDPSIPLTVGEWEEWGNPAVAEEYGWMASYSPYDNAASATYPALLVTAGFNDPRVAYWEPAKWVAKLRTVNQGDRPILLRTKLGAGHSGPSGRYDSWQEQAFVLAFVLDQLHVPL